MEGTAEDAAKIQPQLIRSQFTHIYAVVWYEEECDRYRYDTKMSAEVAVLEKMIQVFRSVKTTFFADSTFCQMKACPSLAHCSPTKLASGATKSSGAFF